MSADEPTVVSDPAGAPLDRRGAGRAPRRVPRHHDLEDPLPREPGPHRPRAHAVGVPEVLPTDVARLRWILHQQQRQLPAAEGDQGAPRPAPTRRAACRPRRRTAPPNLRRPTRATSRDDGREACLGRRRAGAATPPTPADPSRRAIEPPPAERRGATRPGRRARRTFVPTLPLDDGRADDDGGPDDVSRPTRVASSPRRPASRPAGRRARELRPAQPALRAAASARYDDDALEVAQRGGRLLRPRHRGPAPEDVPHFAEREASLFGQVLLPYLRQRNPEARARLQDELVELARSDAGCAPRSCARRCATRSPSDTTAAQARSRLELAARPRRRSTAAVAARSRRAEIAADHPDGVVLVGVLKGALIFLADLARAISTIDVAVDFLAISRYAPDSGRVRILQDVELDLSGRDVVARRGPRRHRAHARVPPRPLRGARRRVSSTCARCSTAPRRRIVPARRRATSGTAIPDVFVLGYGLHLADRYRNVPLVVEADRARRPARPRRLRRLRSTVGDRFGRRVAKRGRCYGDRRTIRRRP